MDNTLNLKKSIITLSGKEIDRLVCAFDRLKPADYREMVRLETRLKGVSMSNEISLSKKTSPEFRMAAAWVAAVHGTEGLCVDDIEKINILDLLSLEEIGLLFFADLE